MTALSSLPLSHSISRDFMATCIEYAVNVPVIVKERLCKVCCVVQLPSITYSARLRSRSSRSRLNRSSSLSLSSNKKDTMGSPQEGVKRLKYRNEVVRRCFVCGMAKSFEPACKRPRGGRRTMRTVTTTTSSSTLIEGKVGTTCIINQSSRGRSGASTATSRFSFLPPPPSSSSSSMNSSAHPLRRSSAPGDLGDGDFIPLNSSSKSAEEGSARGQEGLGGEKRLNLLELEQLKKKNKKQRTTLEGSSSNASLGTLKNLFGLRK